MIVAIDRRYEIDLIRVDSDNLEVGRRSTFLRSAMTLSRPVIWNSVGCCRFWFLHKYPSCLRGRRSLPDIDMGIVASDPEFHSPNMPSTYPEDRLSAMGTPAHPEMNRASIYRFRTIDMNRRMAPRSSPRSPGKISRARWSVSPRPRGFRTSHAPQDGGLTSSVKSPGIVIHV